MPLGARSASLAEVLDRRTREAAEELTERLGGTDVRCYACGHRCLVREGKRGICKVRFNERGRLLVPAGYVAALACDPTEKKPFFHLLPGSDTLTFGMLGCDLHCAYCLAPGVRIATTQGAIRIEDLFKQSPRVKETSDAEVAFPDGLRVFAHTGEVRSVRGIFRHRYDGLMLKIQTACCPPVECTPDHKLLAVRRPKHGREPGRPEFIKAGELGRDYCLALPRRCANSGDVVLDVPEVIAPLVEPSRMRREMSGIQIGGAAALGSGALTPSGIARAVGKSRKWVYDVRANLHNGVWDLEDLLRYDGKVLVENDLVRLYNEHAPGIPRQLPLDERLAALLGYYCAEGNVWQDKKRRANSGMLTFSFGPHEAELAHRTHRLLREVFGINAAIEKRQTTLAVVSYKSSVALLFAGLCGVGSANKRVPAQMFATPLEAVRAFLQAYVEGDGCRQKNGCVETATNSEERHTIS